MEVPDPVSQIHPIICTVDANDVTKTAEHKVFIDKNLGGELRNLCRDHIDRKGRDFSYKTGEYNNSCSFFSFIADAEMTSDEYNAGGVCRKMVPLTEAMITSDAGKDCVVTNPAPSVADPTSSVADPASSVAAPELSSVDAIEYCEMPVRNYKRTSKGFSDRGGCDAIGSGQFCMCTTGSEPRHGGVDDSSAMCVRELGGGGDKVEVPATCADGSVPVAWGRKNQNDEVVVSGWTCTKAPGGPKCNYDITNDKIRDDMKKYSIEGYTSTSSGACRNSCQADDSHFMFLENDKTCYCAQSETGKLLNMHPIDNK